jgi:hypothetical protein
MADKGPRRLRLIKKEVEPAAWLAWLKKAWIDLWDPEKGRPGLEWAVVLALGAFLSLLAAASPWSKGNLGHLVGLFFVSVLLLRVIYRTWFTRLELRTGAFATKDRIFIVLAVLLGAFLMRGYGLFAGALAGEQTGISLAALVFGAPLCAGPLLAALFMGPRAGMLLAMMNGGLSALAWSESEILFVYFLLTGVIAAHQVKGGSTRSALIRAGSVSSLTGMAVVTAIALLKGWFISVDYLVALLAAGVSGVVGGVLAAGFVPLCEMAFGYITDIKLMEQASLDQPILRELMLQAPGTYHHSLVVGSLVEAAAREIGANHRLAKVAALYHDVGKLKKPAYFVENQFGGINRHEKLAPSMSALILTSHVKEGVEMAKKHRLGQPIIDIMAQHHGTRVIKFFYNKAVECRKAAGQNPPDPEAFCYPGPRPQTREAGLVMLADTVEAAARALDNPTPSRLQGLVQTQVNTVFAEGQLDECELTLKDLHKIAKSFYTILNGIFHQRLEYPQVQEKAKKSHADTDKQPAAGAADSRTGSKEQTATGLRRLGMH